MSWAGCLGTPRGTYHKNGSTDQLEEQEDRKSRKSRKTGRAGRAGRQEDRKRQKCYIIGKKNIFDFSQKYALQSIFILI